MIKALQIALVWACFMLLTMTSVSAQHLTEERHLTVGTVPSEKGAALESVKDLEMNRTSDDTLEITFELRNSSYTFELTRFRHFYGAKAHAFVSNKTHDGKDTNVYDAKFTFITPSKSNQHGVTTIMPDGTAHGVFMTNEGHFVRVSTIAHFERKLGQERFRELRTAGENLDKTSHTAPRYLAAQVLAPRSAGSNETDDSEIDSGDLDSIFHDSKLNTSNHLRRLITSSSGETCDFPESTTVIDIGIVFDQQLVDGFDSDEDQVKTYIESTVAESNLILRKYANTIVRIKELNLNNFGSSCVTSLNSALTETSSYASGRSDVAHWHRITGCTFTGWAGLAKLGQLCSKSLSSTTAVSTVGTYDETFIIFLHEVGHVFGAVHPFSSTTDAGSYGGIMDYGDGKLKDSDVYGFTDNSLVALCTKVNALILNDACSFASSYSDESPVCGDGIVSGDEDCECPNGKTKCSKNGMKCQNCVLTKRNSQSAECNSNFIMRILHGPTEGSQAHPDCCTKNGVLADAETECDVVNGVAGGYCSLGQCVNRCADYFGRLDLCGTQASRGGCRQQCIHPSSGYCTSSLWIRNTDNEVTYVTNIDDGAKCTLTSGETGMCSSGSCVADDEAN